MLSTGFKTAYCKQTVNRLETPPHSDR